MGHSITGNITGIPYVDNCVEERAYKRAESACESNLSLVGIKPEQFFSDSQKSKLLFFSDSQKSKLLFFSDFAKTFRLHQDSVPS